MNLTEKDLQEIFGSDGLCFDAAALQSVTASQVFLSGVRPWCIAYPTTSQQVERFMKLAAQTCTPVIPMSSAPAHRHGGVTPLREGTVVLSLERMNALVEVNAPFRMVTVEAGMTYEQLQPLLAQQGLMVDMPLAPKAGKSVAASLLEGEPRLNPNIQWASYAPLSCCEVTWGDGVRMFTGEAGAVPPDYQKMRQERHITMTSSSGPGSFDYNRMLHGAQGTTGVVTWVAFRCAVLPHEHRMFFAAADKPDELIGLLYDLEHVRFGDSLMLLDAVAFAGLMGATAREAEELRARLPKWICAVSFADRPPFPSRRAAAHETGARRFAENRGLALVDELAGVSAEDFRRRVYTPCLPGKYWKDTLRGGCAEVRMMTTLNKAASFAHTFRQTARDCAISQDRLGVYIQPMNQGVNCQCEFLIFYDPADAADTAAARALWEKVSRVLSQKGAYYARPIGLQTALQYAKDSVSYSVQRRLKDIFDPSGIMNPGKLIDYEKEAQA